MCTEKMVDEATIPCFSAPKVTDMNFLILNLNREEKRTEQSNLYGGKRMRGKILSLKESLCGYGRFPMTVQPAELVSEYPSQIGLDLYDTSRGDPLLAGKYRK